MSIITIVGAGQMGSAMCFPARSNGHEVRLVGTPLDREIIERAKVDRWHLNLKRYLPEGVKYYQIEDMRAALMGADLLIGGVSSYLIFYNLYVYVVAPRTKIKALQNNMNASLTDALPFIPIGITIAHAFGRLGCTFAGCCYGKEADWGIYFATAGTKVIPTQLFECIFLVILSVVMAVLYFKFKFNCNLGLYLVAYGVWRFIIEFFRNDDRGSFIPGLSPSQFWCIIMVLAGIGYFFLYKYVLKAKMKHPELQPSVRKKKGEEESK